MKRTKLSRRARRALGVSLAVAMAFGGMPTTTLIPIDKIKVAKAADSTVTIDSTAIVQQIDSKTENRPGIPDGTLLNELKRLVNTSLGRDAAHDITFGELMAYNGEIDLSGIASQITSINGIGYARKATKVNLTNVSLQAIDDYEFDGCTELKEVILPNGLSTIGKFAFRNCKKMDTITLPESVTSIGESSFDACISLNKMTIPNGVTNIGKGAFGGCIALESMEITNPNVVLGASVFEACTSLRSCKLPEGIKSIPASFFASSGLSEFTVPTTVEIIEKSAFNNTWLTFVDLTACTKLTVIGNSAYAGSLVQEIKLPESLTTIRSNAFEATMLRSITIPEAVAGTGASDQEPGIASHAFWNCYFLQSASIPKGVEALQENTFAGCWSLNKVEFRDAASSKLKFIGKGAFADCVSMEDTEFIAKLPVLEEIGAGAFVLNATTLDASEFYTGMKEKNLTDSKDLFGNKIYKYGLTSIHLPNSLQTLGNGVFNGQVRVTKVDMGNGLKELPDKTFSGFVNLETVIFSNSLQKIGASAFENCMRLQEVNLPNSLEEIGASAFLGASPSAKSVGVSFTTYYFKDEDIKVTRGGGEDSLVESIVVLGKKGQQTFGIRYVDIKVAITATAYGKLTPKEQEAYTACHIVAQKKYVKNEGVYKGKVDKATSKSTFTYDEGLDNITAVTTSYFESTAVNDKNMLVVPTEGYTGFFFAMSGTGLNYTERTGFKKLVLPDSVKTIGEKAFYDCYGLEEVTLSKQLQNIAKSAFALKTRTDLYVYDWTDKEKKYELADYFTKKQVTFKEGNENIEDSAFFNNSNMVITNNALPISLKKIGVSAFEECRSLSSITIPSKTEEIGNRAFFGCSEYEKLKEKIGNYATYAMEPEYGLQEMDMTQASSLKKIGTYAFSLTTLRQCSVPDGVTVVDEGLFQNCFYLTKVTCSDNLTQVNKLALSDCERLVSVTIPAKAMVDYNAFAGYTIGDFSFAITDPDPVSVSIGETFALPINTFLNKYMRDELQIKEKDGTTGYLEIADPTVVTVNKQEIRVPNVKGLETGTTRVSVMGTMNFAFYGSYVLTKAPEVIITVNVTKNKCTGIEDTRDNAVVSIENTKGVSLTPNILPANCTENCTWQTANSSIVAVQATTKEGAIEGSSAIIVPKSLGTSRVTLTCGSVKKNYQVNVVVPATQLNAQDQMTIALMDKDKNVGASMTYNTGAYTQAQWDNYGDIVAYESSNTSVVKVSASGDLTPISAGTAKIKLQAMGSGLEKEVTVTVTKSGAQPSTASPSVEQTATPNQSQKPGETTAPNQTSTPSMTATPATTQVPNPTATPKVKVSKVTGVTAKNVKGKKIKVTWKKVSGVNGYRLIYALNNKFTKSKKTINLAKSSKSKTISKLKKGKTYYIKLQAYKIVNGKKIYSKDSAVKKVKVKK